LELSRQSVDAATKSQDFQTTVWKSLAMIANRIEAFCQMLEDRWVVPCLCMSVSPSQAKPRQSINTK